MEHPRQSRWSGSRVASLIACLVCNLYATAASAFIDPPVLVPPNPVAGETVSVSIRHGDCDGFISAPPQISREGNAIHMLLASVHYDDPLWCQVWIGTTVFPVGLFQPGDYTLHVERFYETQIPTTIFETLANVTFTVSGAVAPVALPATSITGALLLILGVIVIVWRTHAARRTHLRVPLLLVALMFPLGTSAQTPGHIIEVLLSGAPGAPTPDEVVYWSDTSPGGGDPPLEAFDIVAPISVNFALSYRANPELQAWLDVNPESDRAKLERYILVKYPEDIDVEAALQSLLDDDDVEAAYVSIPVELSSVSLHGFSVGQDEPAKPYGGSYAWNTLNLEAAWNRATGYALIGATDTGLYVNHAALRQFSATGQHIDGNFIPAASLDVGRGYPSLDFNVDEQEPEPITDPVCDLPGDFRTD